MVKNLAITKMPKILTVQLKRFTYNVGGLLEKNRALVKFPLQKFELGSEQFVLASKVNHFGSLHGGHYTATCRHGDRWLDCSFSRELYSLISTKSFIVSYMLSVVFRLLYGAGNEATNLAKTVVIISNFHRRFSYEFVMKSMKSWVSLWVIFFQQLI